MAAARRGRLWPGTVPRPRRKRLRLSAASEAYIKSQSHEGWRLIRDRYDDGGYSGASMERPALRILLDDVRAKRVDVVVVYKVDRLARSPISPSWSSCSTRTASASSRSPSLSTRRPVWGG